jgi:threonine/homoserine/homoserine lactone efflux protein
MLFSLNFLTSPLSPSKIMGVLESAILGAGLAFSLAVPPGPINAMMAATSVTNRFRASLIGFGAMTADAIFLSVVILLHGAIPGFLKPPLAVIGGFIIIFMGAKLIMQKGSKEGSSGGYFSGLFVGISNPYQLGWWITGGLTMVSIFGYASIAGFFGALFIWVTAFPLALSKLTQRYKDTIPRLVRLVSAIALFLFGIYFLASGTMHYIASL